MEKQGPWRFELKTSKIFSSATVNFFIQKKKWPKWVQQWHEPQGAVRPDPKASFGGTWNFETSIWVSGAGSFCFLFLSLVLGGNCQEFAGDSTKIGSMELARWYWPPKYCRYLEISPGYFWNNILGNNKIHGELFWTKQKRSISWGITWEWPKCLIKSVEPPCWTPIPLVAIPLYYRKDVTKPVVLK